MLVQGLNIGKAGKRNVIRISTDPQIIHKLRHNLDAFQVFLGCLAALFVAVAGSIIVDYETSTPINAERFKYGQRVAVFTVGCPEFFRSDKALEAVAPRCFGFDMGYVPLEQLPRA